jgi:gamma-glutamylcyclotransferase (GGCT)/AIG2-like uncharacterized protein YtfP
MQRDHFHLFTYGSLKSADASVAARELLAGCERVAEGAVRGTLYDLGHYPALLLSGTDVVRGVVWRCPIERLPVLDAYEDTGRGLFNRAATRVDGRACWIYVAGPRLGPRLVPEARITGGFWPPGEAHGP